MAGGTGGGGAWKVAYADFVTAMMALFMVLWISAQDQKILLATSRYFQAPFNSPLSSTSGVLQLDSNRPANRDSGNKPDAQNKNAAPADKNLVDLQFLNSVAKDFYRLLNLDENLADKPIDIQVTSDGLRITLFDRSQQPLFKDGTTRFTAWGDFVMQNLAWMIDRYGFRVVIEGHTRHGLELTQDDYTPWELSADRANASRRALTRYAVEPTLIERVTGYADTRPMAAMPADSESNQRVTLSLRPGPRAAPASTAGHDDTTP
ncbi:MAG TPA: flagellar motor protein MotB [Opitutaceae bacterium]